MSYLLFKILYTPPIFQKAMIWVIQKKENDNKVTWSLT